MAILVREAEVADAGAIATSHVRSWQVGYANVISGELLRGLGSELAQRTLWWQTIILGAEAEDRFVLVVEFDDELAGWLGGGPCRDAKPDEPLGEVIGCYVDPAHWRKGLGSALMAAGIERLTRAGYQLAVLWVLTDNVGARAFYEHQGWLADREQKMYEMGGERYPEVRYRLSLARKSSAAS
jgi:GNAT superfamily N-acetyltransferase